LIHLRKLVSGYSDVIKAGVRLKNQRAALFRSSGKIKEDFELKDPAEKFVLAGLDQQIEHYEEERLRYMQEFQRYARKNMMIKRLKTIPGISDIGAAKIAAYVVEPGRFESRGHFLAYCGLVKHEKLSGGTSYGRRTPRYNRTLKGVFKTAAIIMINKPGPFKSYYDHLCTQGRAEHEARHAVSRRIAVITLGVMKGNEGFKPKENWIREKTEQVA
jgi:transposase